jgi:single-stranded-DNA-specific exonuclease
MSHATDGVPAGMESPNLPSIWKPRAVVSGSGPLLVRVFASRGLTDPALCERFLDPRLSELHDPSLLPDIDRAAERILAGAFSGEPMVIYGDYDVDGITATAILYHTIRAIAPDCRLGTYVPHRLDEGYGLNTDAILDLAANGARVIISVDCGVTATQPAGAARDVGVDLIITDHHNPPDVGQPWPDAYAIVHPRAPGSRYPYPHLCGAGVAFKLAWRLVTLASGSGRATPAFRDLLLRLLPLAAIGTIADIVPMTGENRIITRHGLSGIRRTAIAGLDALIEASGLGRDSVDEQRIGFQAAPRLNAGGRMNHARDAVELLTTARGARATEIAEELNRLNERRRCEQERTFRQAIELAENAGMHRPECRAVVLSNPRWHPGVVGIVCADLVRRYARPAVLLCEGDDACKGSGRASAGFSLYAALSRCDHLLEKWGGHEAAAGMEVSRRNLPAFVETFTSVANDMLRPEDLAHVRYYDADAAVAELSAEVVRRLSALGPFGPGNPPVCLRLRGVRVVSTPELRKGRHLFVWVADDTGRSMLELKWWNATIPASTFPRGSRIDAIIRPSINTFGERVRVEGTVVDMKHSDGALDR